MPGPLTKRQQRELRVAQSRVDSWNATVAVGDRVEYRSCPSNRKPTFVGKTRCPAQVLGGHTAVVWLEGFRGCVALTHCRPAPPAGGTDVT